MSKLIYSAITSLDGYVADAAGKFDWAEPDEEVHRFLNELERPIGTYLYGRRMYEVMVAWETIATAGDQPPVVSDFARIWQAADKVVFSRTLTTVSSRRTRLERSFDPESVQRLKDEASGDLTIGGPRLAAVAFQHGLVDELQLFVAPVVVGGGNAALPSNIRLRLNLLEERRFGEGTVFLRYNPSSTNS